MLTKELISTNIPRLTLKDSVGKALGLINDYRISHLPVVVDGFFLGLISEDDLLDAKNEQLPIETLQSSFIKTAIPDNVHFLNAISSFIQYDTNIIPITMAGTDIFDGVITTTDLLKALGNFAGANEIGGIIVVEMERIQFAISEISRIVESNDCNILHLNTTVNDITGMLTVTIHINKKEIAPIIAAFERYDYNIVYKFGNEKFEHDIESNYKNLMKYLDV